MSIFNCYKKKQFIWNYFAIFIVLIGITIFVNSALATEYGGIGGRPAYPRSDNPRTESIFIHTLEPSAIQEEGILLVNNTEEQKTLQVYAVDSMVSSGGAFACKQMAEPKNDVGSWIELEELEVTLDSGTSEIVPFTITVPQNASVGEHNGCIVIQEKKEKVEGQTGMTLSFRTGLRVAITIPGQITRKLEITGFSIESQKDGGFLLQPSVKNLGNVSIDADVQVVTRHLFGLTKIKHGGKFPILRGETSNWNFEFKKPFWGGWYQSSFALEYGEDLGTEIGKETGKQEIRLEKPSVWFFSVPKPLALAIEIIILLLIGFSGFLFWLSKKRKKWIKENWVEYKIKSSEDINSLAKRFDVSWKLLAKVNKLKPPYALNPGQKIKTPPSK
ncbi:MAG: LysM peptidoglycan-binding domain-containing protein [Patescibacteria group bacterium]|nr:LysM peptidoglycan-binding domain-containing protein [Patescibacteria group bacterium]